MMSEYLVSVITPMFNCEHTINETYKSIVAQNYTNWEWIVIDDCSNDKCFDIVKEISKKDKRVKVFSTDRNSGAAIARNIGIENSKGRFICFLDGDDLWLPQKLYVQVNYMVKNQFALTYSNYYVLYDDEKERIFNPKKSFCTYKTLLKSCDIGCLTAMYDTEILGKVYMPTDCLKREDYGLWLDITKKGYKGYKINECLAKYRLSNDSVSHNKFRLIKYQYRVYKRHEKFNFFKSLFYVFICSFKKVFFKY